MFHLNPSSRRFHVCDILSKRVQLEDEHLTNDRVDNLKGLHAINVAVFEKETTFQPSPS